MVRLVHISRWQDTFFIELHPNAKLLLSFLYDTCDNAGFVDANFKIWSVQLNMSKEFILTSLKALQPKLLSDKKKKLFIKDFLKHQKKLPLIRGNEEHDWIITKLKNNLDKFNNAPEILDILNNHVKDEGEIKKTKERVSRKKVFVEPSFDEVRDYYLSEEPKADISDIKDIYDHYVSVGWVTKGGTSIKDWKSAIRKAIRNKEKGYGAGGRNYNVDNKKSRTETTLSVVDEIKKNKE